MPPFMLLLISGISTKQGWLDAKITENLRQKYGQDGEQERSSFSSGMEVAKLSAPPNLEVRYVSCNKSAKRRCLSSELEETVYSLTHELFRTQH